MNTKNIHWAVAALFTCSVEIYRGKISRLKGYRCAHASCRGGSSCSDFAMKTWSSDELTLRQKTSMTITRLKACNSKGVAASQGHFFGTFIMWKKFGWIGALCFALTGCGGGGGGTATDGGSPNNSGSGTGSDTSNNTAELVANVAPASYSGDYATEKAAVFALLNTYRSQCGFGMLAQNNQLDQAAQNHAAYAAVYDEGHGETIGRNGFTGSSPGERFNYVNYAWSASEEILGTQAWGQFLAPNLNNSFALLSASQLGATSNLKALLNAPYHMIGALSMNRDVGIGIASSPVPNIADYNFKQLNINLGTAQGQERQRIASDSISTFPCNGTTGLNPVFAGEVPDPFPDVNRHATPYGQPVYVMTAAGSTVTLDGVRSTITPRGGVALPTRLLTQANDPNARLASNQVFLMPTIRLADNTTYDVVLNGTLSTLVTDANPTGSWSRSFTFYTGVFRGE